MEKLYHLKKIIFIIGFIYTIQITSQTQLCVIEINGNPHVQFKQDYKTVGKGFVYKPEQNIQLETDESIKFIDEKGDIYELTAPGSYGFKEILQHKINNQKASVTKKYFSYLYKKMINDFETNSNAGVVYRSDELGFLIEPKADIKIIKDSISFSWTNNEHEWVTFKITEVNTKKSFSIKLNASSVILKVDEILLKKGKNYTWRIEDTKDYTKPHMFFILNDSQISELEKKIVEFKKELLALGFQKEKINDLISDHFKIQY